MQITQLAEVIGENGAIIEPAGVRLNYFEDGQPFEAIRRPLGNGLVRYVVRNVTTGETSTEDVPESSLEPI